MNFEPDKSLQTRIRAVFEPRYGRALEDVEIEIIAQNLLAFSEAVLRVKLRLKKEVVQR